MLRKSIALIMSVCMLLSLCACGSNNEESTIKNDAKEINNSLNSSENPITTTTAKPEEQLSKTCDMLLCSGYNGNDYYELVANQIDRYPDSTFEIGVLKNNEWLVPLSPENPFINDNGWWVGAEYQNEPGEFKYMGKGCFYYMHERGYPEIVYNPETKISFEVQGLEQQSVHRPTDGYTKNYTKLMSDNYEILAWSSGGKRAFTYFNLLTGETKEIPITFYTTWPMVARISEGVFLARVDKATWGFYDINGNCVIDLSQYSFVLEIENINIFKNGTYTFKVRNSSNIYFHITIDKTGKVLSQEKVES